MQSSSGPTLPAASKRVRFPFLCGLVFATLFSQAVAQKRGDGGSVSTRPPNPTPTTPSSLPQSNATTSAVFLTGKVELDYGSMPPESIIVQEVCGTSIRATTRTDRKGNFSLALGQASNSELIDNLDSTENGRPQAEKQLRLAGCELRAVLNGYVSSEVHLSGADSQSGMRNVGTISLKRRAGAPEGGPLISATSFQVPEKARKEFEKAAKEAEKQKTENAIGHLQKAVEIYPKYASAWVALGQIQSELNHRDEAIAAFRRAMEADDKYVPPYLYLALMAVKQNQWQETLRFSSQAMRLDPVNFPDAYFLNAIANYNLHHLPEAKSAALKAASLDGAHRQPRIQFLLGAIYEAAGERALAAQSLREYIRLAPDAPDSAQARQNLDNLTKQTIATEPR